MSLKQEDTITSIEAGRQNPASVVVLDLSDKQLKEIDLEILMFDNLEELILDGNPELRNLPEELEYLPKLQKLSLKTCHHSLLTQLKVIPNLKVLDISGMDLSDDQNLLCVGNCKTLQEFRMTGCPNPFGNHTSDEGFGHLWQLPAELGNLINLEVLVLDNNRIEKLPDSFRFLTKLRVLSATNNLMYALPAGIFDLPYLQELYVKGNKLKREELSFAKKLTQNPHFKTDVTISSELLRDGAAQLAADAKKQEKEKQQAQQALEQAAVAAKGAEVNPAAEELLTRKISYLSPTVQAELQRLGVKPMKAALEERYFDFADQNGEAGEACIPLPIAELFWGYNWGHVKLEWKKPPFGDSWDDEEYEDEDEDFLEQEKSVAIDDGFYLGDTCRIDDDIFLAIGSFQSAGHLHRLTVSLSDSNMSDPMVYMDDFESEPEEHTALSDLLAELTTPDRRGSEAAVLTRYLECVEGKSSKFWKIKVVGNMHIIQYGKIGTDGQKQEKDFSSPEEALKQAEKLVESKIKKGYEES